MSAYVPYMYYARVYRSAFFYISSYNSFWQNLPDWSRLVKAKRRIPCGSRDSNFNKNLTLAWQEFFRAMWNILDTSENSKFKQNKKMEVDIYEKNYEEGTKSIRD